VLLGLVLGPLAENRLFLSTDNYGSAWITRPAVLGIFALTLFGIFYPMIKSRREERERSQEAAQAHPLTEAPGRQIQFGAAALFTTAIIVLLALALWQSRNFGYRAGLFPWVIATPTLILALGQLIRDLYGKKKEKIAGLAESVETHVDIAPELVRHRTISILCWTIGFFLVIWFIGFSYAVPLTIFLYLRFAGKENWPITISVTFFSWLFYWSLFERLLNVPFPEGLLIELIKGTQ
jgi:hypothetical protein